MCGICGFGNYSNTGLIKLMTGAIIHRGPDEDGFYEERDTVSLGMRRLKIIDLKTGSQPISNEDGSVITVFNGEIYNFKELRENLEKKGHRFKTNTDTEVIVHLYEEYGADCSKHMRGMFAFAVWDKKTKTLILSRDHFGIKPLYYSVTGNKLFFGSEIKSLLLSDEISREIDYKAVNYYFTLLYIPAPMSIYKHIKKLPPAHTLVYRGGQINISKYWEIPKYTNEPKIYMEKDFMPRVEHTLSESIREQMVSDVPLGIFLSGGIDSSAIAYYASSVSREPVKTFNIGYSDKDASYNEMLKARHVAKMLGCDHSEYIVTPDISALLEKMVRHFDEPFADSSSIPTYLVCRESRRKVTVALTGIGGDEIFAGYPRYLGARLSTMYDKVPYHLRKLAYFFAGHIPENLKSRNLSGWAKRFTKGSLLDFKARYLMWMSALSHEEKTKLFSENFKNSLSGKLELDDNFMNGLKNPDGLMAADFETYLAGDLLCHADRMSMANSLELRVPFLDVRLVELMSAVPLSVKTKGFSYKHILKKILSKKLPPEILGQKKMGFQVPIGRWINEEIEPLISDLLSPVRIKESGLLNPDYVSQMITLHRRGARNFTDQLYAVLIMELWHNNLKNIPLAQNKIPSLGGRKLTILSLTDIIHQDDHGGSGRAAWEISKSLKEKGHKVLLITKGTGKRLNFETVDGIDIYRYHTNPLKLRLILRSIMSKHKIDVLHFHHPYTSYWALGLAKNINAVYMFYSPWHEEYNIRRKDLNLSKLRGKIGSTIRKKMEKSVLLSSKKIITNSSFMHQKLLAHHGMESDVMALGVDTSRFSPSAAIAPLRKKFGIPADKFVILTVRNLASRMGIENLISAMPEVLRAYPNAYCIIGGSGYLKEKLEKQITGLALGAHVRLEGRIADEILHEYYQSADLFVLPTKQLEGFGLVTLEAMSCGTPVIATPVAANIEVLGNFDSRFLLNGYMPEDIAEGIVKFIPEYYMQKDAIRERCRKFTVENYSWKKAAEKIERVFYELVK